MLISTYVLVRVATQFGPIRDAAPFSNGFLTGVFAFINLALLAGAFAIVAIFTEHVALSVVG
jgi:hypothetical protein